MLLCITMKDLGVNFLILSLSLKVNLPLITQVDQSGETARMSIWGLVL